MRWIPRKVRVSHTTLVVLQHVGLVPTIVGQCARMCKGMEHVHHCHTLCQLVETPNLVSNVCQQFTQYSGVRKEGGERGKDQEIEGTKKRKEQRKGEAQERERVTE